MTNEERDLISQFVARAGGGAQPAGFGSVPATAPSDLPPIDREADAFIGEQFAKYPEARYRITQLAFVQEHALTAAQNRINELQAALAQARQAAPQGAGSSPWGQAAQPAQQPQQRGFLSGLFGGGSAPPPPRPQYAPQPQPQYAAPQYAPQMPMQMAQQSGTGFLGGALRTAAGVAGGVVAGNALMSMFSGHGGGMFGGGISDHSGFGGEQGSGMGGSGWGAPAGGDSYDQGGALKDDGATYADNTGWSQPPQDSGGGWTDTSNVADNSGGGWTDTSDSGGGGGWDDTSNS